MKKAIQDAFEPLLHAFGWCLKKMPGALVWAIVGLMIFCVVQWPGKYTWYWIFHKDHPTIERIFDGWQHNDEIVSCYIGPGEVRYIPADECDN